MKSHMKTRKTRSQQEQIPEATRKTTRKTTTQKQEQILEGTRKTTRKKQEK